MSQKQEDSNPTPFKIALASLKAYSELSYPSPTGPSVSASFADLHSITLKPTSELVALRTHLAPPKQAIVPGAFATLALFASFTYFVKDRNFLSRLFKNKSRSLSSLITKGTLFSLLLSSTYAAIIYSTLHYFDIPRKNALIRQIDEELAYRYTLTHPSTRDALLTNTLRMYRLPETFIAELNTLAASLNKPLAD